MRRRALLRAGAATVGSTMLLGTGSSAADEHGYEPLGQLNLAGAKDAAVVDDVAYVAKSDGIVSIDISDPSDPTILAERTDLLGDRENGPLRRVWDVWPDGDRLLAPGPANPVRRSVNGFALFDISDPADPTVVADAETEFSIHNSFFEDGIVYLTGNGVPGNPLVAYSTENDDLEEIARWSPFDFDEEYESVNRRLRSLHDIYVRDGLAYLLYWDIGTFVVDVSDPTAPEYVTHFSDYDLEELVAITPREAAAEAITPEGNHHYGTLGDDGDIFVLGKESWAIEREDGSLDGGPDAVELWDVSDLDAPTRLSRIEPPESYDNTRSGQFTTSHNCDLVGDRLYTSWYFGGVKVHDVSDPANPEELAWWRDPGSTSFWTAQAGEPGEFFVGASADLGDAAGGFYTFPDRAGEQADPPSLTEPPGGSAGEDADGTAGEPNETENTTSPDSEDAPAGNESDGDDSVPGFEAIAGAAGIAGGAWALARRRDSE